MRLVQESGLHGYIGPWGYDIGSFEFEFGYLEQGGVEKAAITVVVACSGTSQFSIFHAFGASRVM